MSYLLLSILFTGTIVAETEAFPGDIIITEIYTRSNGNIPDYIEIYNKSQFIYSLLDWKISIFGTEYVFDSNIYGGISDAMDISPNHYMIITGQDGYFTDSDDVIHLANGDLRLNAESSEYNIDFASFVQSAPDTSLIENAIWAPFAL